MPRDHRAIFTIAMRHYFGVGFLLMGILAVYVVAVPSQISFAAMQTLEFLMLGYLLIAPFRYLQLAYAGRISGECPTRTYRAAVFLSELPARIFSSLASGSIAPLRPDAYATQALLSVAVKGFFAPLMISFFFIHASLLARHLPRVILWISGDPAAGSGERVWSNMYISALQIIFIIDTLVFAVAYLVESGALGNTIRSVDRSFSGWAAAMICYPPFNAGGRLILITVGIGAAAPETVVRFPVLLASQLAAICFFVIYVWASIALGARAGNLVNRGIVNRGPYRYIRHPSYAAKNLSWFFQLIPVLQQPTQLLYFGVWAAIYVARALTEERHLGSDPDYQRYRQKVPYRFIPGVI